MVRRLLPLLLLIAACGGRGVDPPVGATSTAPPVAEVVASVDWTARTATVTGTPLGLAFCEGEAPLLCITSPDGQHLGVIEHLETDPVDDLAAFATDHSLSVQQDRAEHCDPGYTVEADPNGSSTLFGARAVRYGFTGQVGGRVVERVVGHAANVDGRFHIVAASFLADDGCLARESELPISSIDDVEPLLDAVAAGSTL